MGCVGLVRVGRLVGWLTGEAWLEKWNYFTLDMESV